MKNSKHLIEVESLWKKYCRDLKRSLHYGLKDLFSELCIKPASSELRSDEFWAIQNVSFKLQRGQCLGLIGGNGAGKSTLLKILSGLVRPTRGRVKVNGSIQSLIELGTGFHPSLNGVENIIINGTILGLPQEDIKKKTDEILDFAELREFANTPVQSYSTGMKARLGFSIAIQMNPDILLIDEVLSVGDQSFKEKSRQAIRQKINQNKVVILTSHNTPFISNVATEGLYINRGKQEYYGPNFNEADNKYRQDLLKKKDSFTSEKLKFCKFISSSGNIFIISVKGLKDKNMVVFSLEDVEGSQISIEAKEFNEKGDNDNRDYELDLSDYMSGNYFLIVKVRSENDSILKEDALGPLKIKNSGGTKKELAYVSYISREKKIHRKLKVREC